MADAERDKKFSSFRDLRRARGGSDEPEPEPASHPGWTLDTGDGGAELAGDDLSGAADARGGARERIAARPAAFGPMDLGDSGEVGDTGERRSPVYADTESEEMQLLHSFRVRTVFPEDVLAEVARLPADPDAGDHAGREDLRDATIFTIDGEDARDFDDAIGIEELPGGALRVGVHIADVGHYVRPGTALDAEALARGTSVYLPDQVVPMLPEGLSNGLCSLVPHRDRLAYSVSMTFDAAGRRVDARVHKSVIKSAHRNTYRVVQDLLDGKRTDETAAIAHLREPLKLFERWTKKQQALRDARGSLRIQSTERKFFFDANHEVERIGTAPRYFSQTLIEETALAANQAVGDLFRARGLPTIYRVHPEKDPEEIDAVAELLAEHGIRVPKKDRLTGRDIGRMIRAARRRPNADALIQRIMGLVERASYEVRDHEDVARHFGLARQAYLHFTSPIRRYPDLVVHRWLWAIESRGEEAASELRAEALVQDLNDVASHCSIQAEVAEMAEQAVGDLKVCQFMEPHVGERVEAVVARVSRYGIEVTLRDYNVTGFVPTRTLGDRPVVEGPTLTVRVGKRSLSFSEGYPTQVVVQDVDFIKLQVLLSIA